MVEAQPVHDAALKTFATGKANVQVAMAAAGDRQGEIYFDASDPYGGIASPTPFPANNIVVPVTTLGKGSRTNQARRGSAATGSGCSRWRCSAIERAQPVQPVPVATITPDEEWRSFKAPKVIR